MKQLRELSRHLCEANNELEKTILQIRRALSEPGTEANESHFQLAQQQLCQVYHSPFGPKAYTIKKRWTEEETEKLLQYLKEGNSYKKIACMIPNKTAAQCEERMKNLRKKIRRHKKNTE